MTRIDRAAMDSRQGARDVLLAVDSSQRLAHLALASPAGGLLAARSFESSAAERRERFWDALRELCAEAGCGPASLAAIGVATGPGGFTGLRVSIAFAKAVAFAQGVPVVGLPSAEVFAASDACRGGHGPWLVVLAAKDATAWVVEVERENGAEREDLLDAAPPAPGSLAAVRARVRAVTPGQTLGVSEFGAAFARNRARGGAILADGHLPEAFRSVASAHGDGATFRGLETDPAALVALAAHRLAEGGASDPFELLPIYPREPEAVTKWRERGRSAR